MRKLINIIALFLFVECAISFDLYQQLQTLDIDSNESVLNTTCVQDIRLIFSTIANQSADKEWAITIIDSNAKIPNGLLGGSLYHFGQFDECLSATHPDGLLQGQHCLAQVTFNVSSAKRTKAETFKKAMRSHFSERELDVASITLWYGLCIPSTCTTQDLNGLVEYFNITNVAIEEKNCWTEKPLTLSDGSWAVISLLIFLMVLTLCSTIFEMYQIHVAKKDKPGGLLTSFSLFSNSVSLFEVRNGSGDMACLHGLRTLSMLWVVLGHTFEAFPMFPVLNLIDASQVLEDNSYFVVISGFYSVDTFFFLSGLLVAFVFFRNIAKTGSFDAPVSYIHRYIRLTPSLVLLILVNMTLMGDTSKGPLWGAQMAHMTEECKNTWWSTILYVQNYVQPQADCLGQAWYLACDMQMFWIAPIILFPLYLWPKIGMGFLGVLILGFTALTLGLALDHEYKASLSLAEGQDQFENDYITTHTRIIPWLVGIALGVAICAIQAKKIKIRLEKMTVIVGWTLSTGICFGILYGIVRFLGDANPTVDESAVYLTFSRLGWGIGLSWIVFACIYGYGGWVNSILSAGLFQPLGKLSYNVFLIHKTILAYRAATFRTSFYFDNLNAMYEFTGVLVISYLLSIVLYLLVDAPFGNLDRQLLSKIKIFPYPPPKKQTENNNEF